MRVSPYELHLGDCLAGMAGLADKSVDVVLTDPPYSEHVHRNLGREDRNDGAATRDALGFSCITSDTTHALMREWCRIGKRWIVVFCDERAVHLWAEATASVGGEFVRGGTWVKTDGMPQMSGDRPAAGTESIVIAHAPRLKGSGRMRWNGGGRAAVWTGSVKDGGDKRAHPTQKPLWLMEALVRDFTDPGELVLDPFAGSGSTGVACIRNGRRFVGWERDEKYHAAAMKRLAAAREQLALFGATP